MEISSKDNPLIGEMRQLLSQAKYRKKTGRFVIEGVRLCEDAVRSGAVVTTFVYTERAKQQYGDVWAKLDAAADKSVCIAERLAPLVADTKTPQGFFAVCQDVRRPFADDILRHGGRYIALENIQDPANIGTIVRTAEAMGLDGLLVSADCCDLTAPKVVRGSMGGVFRLPIVECADFPSAIQQWQAAGLPVYACVPDRAADSIRTVSFRTGGIALIGNEANGLTPSTIAAATGRVTIPMDGNAESLNAAVAASIVAWEMTR